MTKLAVRLCILTCMLCPDREIVRLYIPKAKRALEEVEGVVFSEKDIRSVNGVIDINYDSYKDAADTPKCKQQYKSLVDYVNEHYHNLQIGTRYTWEEICRECPYRFVFLSSGYIDDYGVDPMDVYKLLSVVIKDKTTMSNLEIIEKLNELVRSGS